MGVRALRTLGYPEPAKASSLSRYVTLILSSKWRTKFRISCVKFQSQFAKYELVIWIIEGTEITATAYYSFTAAKTKAD